MAIQQGKNIDENNRRFIFGNPHVPLICLINCAPLLYVNKAYLMIPFFPEPDGVSQNYWEHKIRLVLICRLCGGNFE